MAGGAGIAVYLLLWLLMPAGSTYSGASAAPRVKAPAGPRSPVPGMTIAALLIVVGVLALIDRFSGWDLGPSAFLGAALLVVGLGLVAAAFSGGRRARGGLIALGIVLSLALAAASSMPWKNIHGFRGGVGDRTFMPATAAQVLDIYRNGAGDMTVDLTRVDVSNLSGPISTRIEHGVGNTEVRVPADADVRLTVDSGVGNLDVFDQGSVDSGFFPGTGTGSWVDDGRPEFVITLNSGVGDVEVSRG
jgi:Cell wall-active antibiotics response 4TMS YvqF